MKSDKRQFKYAVRRLKRDANKICMDALAWHMLNGFGSQFWKTVQKMKSLRLSQATFINGLSNENDIVEL